MIKLIGKMFGASVQLLLLPFAIILAIPMAVIKARRAQAARLLFTGDEQSLLSKAQRAINMDESALISPDRDLVAVARCIENARIEYQLINSRERFDTTFSEFLAPQLNQCNISDWSDVFSFFNLVSCGIVSPNQNGRGSQKFTDLSVDMDNDIPF